MECVTYSPSEWMSAIVSGIILVVVVLWFFGAFDRG